MKKLYGIRDLDRGNFILKLHYLDYENRDAQERPRRGAAMRIPYKDIPRAIMLLQREWEGINQMLTYKERMAIRQAQNQQEKREA